MALCAVGPTARASGIPRDVRKDDPHAVYDEVPFEVCTADTCDVLGRTVVRIKELFESYKICEFLLRNLPAGADRGQGAEQGQAERGRQPLRGAARRKHPLHQVQRHGQARAAESPGPDPGQLPGHGGDAQERIHRRHPPDLRGHRPLHLLRRADGRAGRRPERAKSRSSASATSGAGRGALRKTASRKGTPYGRSENPSLPPRLPGAPLPVRLFDLLRVVRPQGLRPAPEPDGPDAHRPLRPPPADRRFRQADGQGGHRPGAGRQEALQRCCRSSASPSSSPPGCSSLSGTSTLGHGPMISFSGDIIILLYLLSLPTLILFLAAWSSTNLFSTIGGTRVLTMLFGYEVPLFMAVLSPAILADSWRLSEIALVLPAPAAAPPAQPHRVRRRPHLRPGQAGADAVRHPPRRDRDRRRNVHRVLGQEARPSSG